MVWSPLAFGLFILLPSLSLPTRVIRIGAIFTDDQKVIDQLLCDIIFHLVIRQDSPTELAFKYAVYKINKDPHILANRYFLVKFLLKPINSQVRIVSLRWDVRMHFLSSQEFSV